jgi:hypothetical protein
MAILVAGLGAIPGFAQGVTGPETLICTVPSLPPGTTTVQAFGELSCGAPGAGQNTTNVQFAAEGTVPPNFVLATPTPILPSDIFASLQQGSAEIRQFVSFSAGVLTVDLSVVPIGTELPTPASATTPPGTVLTQIRIQVQNVIVTNGTLTPTMLFSGTVLPSVTTNGENGTAPLVPNLFGNLSGRAAAFSLAFNSQIFFPGLGNTQVGAGTGTGTVNPDGSNAMFNGGDGAAVPASMLTAVVAGAFAFSSPTGFAALSFPSGSTGGVGGVTGAPVIVFAPFLSPTNSRQIQLDASQSEAASGGGPLTYSWKSTGTNQASILQGDTATPIVQFLGIGPYTFELTVTNAAGRTNTASITVQFVGP